MSVLYLKLLRDLKRTWAQALSIALVVAAGVATFVSLVAAHRSLLLSRESFYDRHRFADAFVRTERAPESVRGELEAIPGVRAVETRLVEVGYLPMPDLQQPASGVIVTQPRGTAPMHELYLREGRLAERSGEAVLHEGFASAHGLRPGDRIPVVMGGTKLDVRVVGTGISPEYVLAMNSLEGMPDPKGFAILWMTRETIGAAFAKDGAFDDVLFRLEPGAPEREVLDAIDRVLEPWGGGKAYPRARQLSHFVLDGELMQLERMAQTIPVLFFAVAAFLLHVVLSRIVQIERPEIAALRALGYGSVRVAAHYLQLALLIAFVGSVLGLLLGGWLGKLFMGVYGEYFQFPDLRLRLEQSLVGVAIGASLLAATLGTLSTLVSIASLRPAEAMRPPVPPRYGRGVLEWLGLGVFLGPAGRLVLRELSRHPIRTALSVLAIALACGLLVTGRFFNDAFEVYLEFSFERAQREDVAVTFVGPRPARALRELAHIPGVRHVEGYRAVPVRFTAGQRWRDGVIQAYPEGATLRHLVGWPDGPVEIPKDGLLITRHLGELLDVAPGEVLDLEILQGERRHRSLVVLGFSDELMGLGGYMGMASLHRMLGEGEAVTTAALSIDRESTDDVVSRLRDLRGVAGVSLLRKMSEQVRSQSEQTTGFTTLILTIFAVTIAVGVLYNHARVALSMRARELASLRVLGFTQREVATVLFGELGAETLLGLPLGMLLGKLMVAGMVKAVTPDEFRLPAYVQTSTYAFAALVTVLAAILSAWLVRGKIEQLDMIEALKTREG